MENKVSIGTRLKAAGKNTVSSYGSVLIAVIALSIVWSFASPYSDRPYALRRPDSGALPGEKL